MTFTSNSVLTAAQLNTHLRDNMLETVPAKTTQAGSHFVGTGVNQIAERKIAMASVLTSESSSSFAGTYGDLATVGPTVTVTTGAAALIILRADVSVDSATASVRMSYDVSGASSIAVADSWSIGYVQSNNAGPPGIKIFASAAMYEATLTPGVNVFTCRYKTSSAVNCTFANRRIIVVPF
jgi:hypothetical protein